VRKTETHREAEEKRETERAKKTNRSRTNQQRKKQPPPSKHQSNQLLSTMGRGSWKLYSKYISTVWGDEEEDEFHTVWDRH